MIIECYGDCKGDKEEDFGSGDYSDGLYVFQIPTLAVSHSYL